VVEFSVLGAPPAEPDLRVLPGVRDVRVRGEAVALATSELHSTVPALLAQLSGMQLTLTLLTTHSATLEDVFVSLTGRQLRDG
jgi:ABC-2 type transport system ATP-binding protein